MGSKVTKTAQFNAVYYETHKKLYSIILNVCRDNDMVLDVLQKTFMQLWEKWDSIQDKTNLYPLLFTYSKNIVIDELRKDCNRKKILENIKNTNEIYSPTAENHLTRKEYLRIFDTLLSRLTNRRREVVSLYLEEGLSRKKLAERLCLSPNTIDNHLQESLIFLRKELKIYMDTGLD